MVEDRCWMPSEAETLYAFGRRLLTPCQQNSYFDTDRYSSPSVSSPMSIRLEVDERCWRVSVVVVSMPGSMGGAGFIAGTGALAVFLVRWRSFVRSEFVFGWWRFAEDLTMILIEDGGSGNRDVRSMDKHRMEWERPIREIMSLRWSFRSLSWRRGRILVRCLYRDDNDVDDDADCCCFRR